MTKFETMFKCSNARNEQERRLGLSFLNLSFVSDFEFRHSSFRRRRLDSSFVIRHSSFAPAFTLIELMISIALVLILMIGINQVFKLTGEATGAGQAQAEGVRNSRAIQSVMGHDIGAMATAEATPCILLRSIVTPAFKNRAEELADRDIGAATTQQQRWAAILSADRSNPPNNSESELEDQIAVTEYGNRSHRTDLLSFFALDLFQRQTGNDGTFVADMSSPEAWVWYGHLWLPNNSNLEPGRFYLTNNATFPTFPGAFDPNAPSQAFSDNPNNLYASQWALGRSVMLLRRPGSSPAYLVNDNSLPSPIPQRYYGDNSATPAPLAPLASKTLDTNGTAAGTFGVYSSRFDLVGADMDGIKVAVRNGITSNPNNWWEFLMLGNPAAAFVGRFQCDPYLIDVSNGNRTLNSRTMAAQSPYFVGHCSQFIVEYAGDFIKQDTNPNNAATYGDALDAYFDPTTGAEKLNGTDSETDFIVVNGKRQIRWYGLPRDTNGDASIPGYVAGKKNNQMPDVVPLRDVLRTITAAAGYGSAVAPFEKFSAGSLPVLAEYAIPYGSIPPGSGYVYTCAWGPGGSTPPPYDDLKHRPKLIRILVTIDDPTGRLADGQTFEYVFKVP